MVPPVLAALKAESATLTAALAAPTRWDAPTRCDPWDAAALTAHVTVALGRLDAMLDAPEPPEATVDAADYYRPDQRFSPEANATRVDTAAAAARAGGPAVAADFAATSARVIARCAGERATRRVTTRHGDPMLLEDFLVTRVVEVAVHGIDLADAFGVPRWTAPEAADVVAALLLGPGHAAALAGLGWDPVGFIARATGRDPFPAAERARAAAAGLRVLALG